ncbi:hypothetical protein BHE90_014790 [Fusarium euwallaceae]|uniref:Uncharacterized protein n=1 Tax=Fusarium euwallaceae TaxID=1147111 RepID=A0A430L500_9HYPO|nr:hypothetical protein BHE90_014790 [Fusarium euwallaceae]
MTPIRKPAGCIRLGAIGAYNSRGGGVQGSRVRRRGPVHPRRVRIRKPSPSPELVVDAEPVADGSPSSFPESEYESNTRSSFEPVQLAATPSDSEFGPNEVAALTPAQIERQAARNDFVPENNDPPCEECIRSATSGKGGFEDYITALRHGHRRSAYARGSHKCIPCYSGLFLLLKALQFAPNTKSPTRDQKKHTANFGRVLETQMNALDEDPFIFEPIVHRERRH